MLSASAYKKEYGKKGQVIRAKINPKTGKVDFSRIILVADDTMVYVPEKVEGEEGGEEIELKVKDSYRPLESELSSEDSNEDNSQRRVRYNPEKHILIEAAEKDDSKLKPGDEITTPLEQKDDFGRIAAQTAKQVVLQKIREAEKENVLAEYKSKEGEIVSGIVQRIEGSNVYFDIGKSLACCPRKNK